MATIRNHGDFDIVQSRTITIQLHHIAGLPEDVHGVITLQSPEKYMIILNASDSDSQQAKSFLHECLHIFHRDLEREDMTASQIEAKRHEELKTILTDLT